MTESPNNPVENDNEEDVDLEEFDIQDDGGEVPEEIHFDVVPPNPGEEK